MRCRVENVKNSFGWSFLPIAVIGAIFLAPAPAVFATDTSVGAMLCGSDAPVAAITITQPNSDTIVDQATTTFRGDVANSAQIEVQIDGQYHSTLAIGATQTSFVVDITLTPGTHTITMAVNDICGGSGTSDSVVITYQPATVPSDGGSTPTDIGGGGVVIGPEAPIGDGQIVEEPTPQQFEDTPVVGAIYQSLRSFAETTGINRTVAQVSPIVATGRVTLTVMALTAVTMAGSMAPLAIQFVPSVSDAFNATGVRLRSYVGWSIRGIGLIAFGLAYLL